MGRDGELKWFAFSLYPFHFSFIVPLIMIWLGLITVTEMLTLKADFFLQLLIWENIEDYEVTKLHQSCRT